jgi:hypothetical protein
MIVLHRRGTTGEWQQADLLAAQLPEVLLKDGEFAIEEREDGSRLVKIGDGHTKFQALPYIDARAETVVSKKLAAAKADVDEKLASLSAKHKVFTTDVAKGLSEQLDAKAALLADAYEAADSAVLAEVKQALNDEISGVYTEITKNTDELGNSIKALSANLYKVESELSNDAVETENRLSKRITTTATTLEKAFEAGLVALEEKITTEQEDRDTLLAEQLKGTRQDIKDLNKSVGGINAAIVSLDTKIGSEAAERIALTKKHNHDTAVLVDAINTKAEELELKVENMLMKLPLPLKQK